MKGPDTGEGRGVTADKLLGLFLVLLALLVVSTMLASLLAGLTGIAGLADWASRILPLWILGLAVSALVIVIGWRQWGLPLVAAKSLSASVTGFVLLFLVAGLLGASIALVLYMLLPGPPTGSGSPPGLLAAMLPVAALGSSMLGWAVGILYFARARDMQLLQAERISKQSLAASEAALQRRNRELEALNAVAIAASRPVGSDQVAARCASGLGTVLGLDVVAIYLLDESALELVLSAQQGIASQVVPEISRLQVADTLTGPVSPSGVVTGEVAIHPRARQWWMNQVDANSMASAFLRSGGKPLGIIHVASHKQHCFTEEDAAFITAMADHTALVIASDRARKELEQAASRDSLTGLYNYGELHRRLGEEAKRAARSGQSLSLLFIDIDNFKGVNERSGHQVGDRVLSYWAAQLRQRLREYDIVGRYGGDEFVVVLPDTPASQACEVAERLHRAVRKASDLPPSLAQAMAALTFSIGVAVSPEHSTDPTRLIECANRAMFFAKSLGGNRVQLWDETVG